MKLSHMSETLSHISFIRRGLVTLVGFCALGVHAQPLRDVHVALSFYASADHGGYYAALAEGIYEKHGLQVRITQVGPQGNNMQQVVSGKADFANGWSMRSLNAVKENIPLVSVAALFQRDPQCLVHHKGAYNSLEQMKGQPVRVSQLARGSWWPWLKAKYGFDDSQLRPFDLGYAALLQDRRMVQQGFVTNEGFQFSRQNLQMDCLLLANSGWSSYNYTIDTAEQTIKSNPKLVADFVQATLEGWKAFLSSPAPATKLIRANNPQMSEEQIAFAVDQTRQQRLLDSPDTTGGRIGNMSDARWQGFYQEMVTVGALPAGLDVRKAYDMRFIRQIYPGN